ncbi:MAG TPA: hypothetical protein VHA52_05950, partial [Candidatus Babeliaceae bacterium]|nr:hypothetical protein [Candidatus Babeliaceae bacterium]
MSNTIGSSLPSLRTLVNTIPNNLKRPSDSKVEEVFAKKRRSASSFAGDSDGELPTHRDKSRVFVFRRDTTPKAETMTLQCQDEEGNIKNIKGSTLIEIAHQMIQAKHKEICEYVENYEKKHPMSPGNSCYPRVSDKGMLLLMWPCQWFMTLGGWKGMMPSQEIKDFRYYMPTAAKRFSSVCIFSNLAIKNGLIFPIFEHRLHITPNFKLCNFDVTLTWDNQKRKTDLSYPQIVRAIEHVKGVLHLDDSSLAQLQLWQLSGGILSRTKAPDVLERIPWENRKEILQ